MAVLTSLEAYSDALVVLGTAGVIVPLARRVGLNPILGYLGAGAVLGPLGVGALVERIPALHWVSINSADNLAGLADLGIVFLLFLIGLELSFERLVAMRRLVLGMGGLQVLLTTVAVAAVAVAAGIALPVAVIIGFNLSLSSTAIVMELLSGEGRLDSPAGRTSFAILLAQDLAVIPMLVLLSILGGSSGESALASLGVVLVETTGALVAIVVLGRMMLRPLFRMAAASEVRELFIAAVLFVIVAAGVAASQAGLSMALGAFVAGLLLAETEFRKAIEATVGPFKGLLLGLFFFTVGMNIDFRELAREPLWLLAAVITLVIVKAAIVAALARLFRQPWPDFLESALLLGPGGEFAFVGMSLAVALGLVGGRIASFVLALTAITMALIPLLGLLARRLSARIAAGAAAQPRPVPPPGDMPHAIVVGYGRIGKVVSALLAEHGVPHIATDLDADAATRESRDGVAVFYGDAADTEFLRHCGLMQASGVIITVDDHAVTDDVVAHVRAMRPDIPVITRARDEDHARHLYAVGASDVVLETLEASLDLAEASLTGLGVAVGPAIASVHARREAFRRTLRQAAAAAGPDAATQPTLRSIGGS